MARPIDLLGLFFVAALSVSCTGVASAAPPAKKSPGKPALAKANAGARTVAVVSAPAAPVVAAIAAPAAAGTAPPAAEVPSAAQAAQAAEVPPAPRTNAALPVNPYATQPPLFAPIDPRKALNEFLYDMKMALPRLPMEGQSILPVIKTVHPTGEKPLVVVSFKCPTEMIGVTPPPTKLLHDLVNAGMDTMNKSNLLAFNMQQVCQ